MTYTEEAKRTLSRKVAEKCGIEDGSGEIFSGRDSCGNSVYKWLHDDWHTIMELCVKHRISVSHTSDGKGITVDHASFTVWMHMLYTDCASPSEAERIARLLALGEC